MDEYGEFVDEDESEYESEAPAAHHGLDDEPDLPGLTDEAKRLIEVAREELESGEQPTVLVPLAVSGFLTSRKKATAAELAD